MLLQSKSIINVSLIVFLLLSVFLCPPGLASDPLESRFNIKMNTPHLRIFANSKKKARRVAIFLEWFLHYMDSNYYQIPKSLNVRVFIFEEKKDFHQYLREKLNHFSDPTGYYNHSRNAFYTYQRTGIGTFAHEMMHAIFYHKNANIDQWSKEGIPALFEKIYGYHTKKRAYFSLGYPNPWRIKELSNRIEKLSLEQIVRRPRIKDSSAERVVALFLYKQGRLKAYFDAISLKQKSGFQTYFEAAFRRSVETLEPQWKHHLKTISNQKDIIKDFPVSYFFNTKTDYEYYISTKGKTLIQFKW